MSKRRTVDDLRMRRRQLERLAAGESFVFERLLGMRGELDVLLRSIDRLTARPGMHAGMHGGGRGLSNLVPIDRYRKGT
jgi:hypothetical protein